MSDLEVIRLKGGKAYPAGAIPAAISYQWLKDDGTPIDLSVGTWTGEAKAEALDGVSAPANLGGGTVTIDVATATATYQWHADDFSTPGRFRMIIWIGNGSNREGSAVFEWTVADAPGSAPTV